MKNKLTKLVWVLLVCVMAAACSGRKPYTQTDITVDELQGMIDNKESFVLLTERDNCPFCEAMNEYINETKKDHAGVQVYRLDTTDLELYKENQEDKTLISSSEDGKKLLQLIPYFLYTPAIYQYTDGVSDTAAFGYDQTTHTVSKWGTDSTVDFNTAEEVDVWTFLEGENGD